MSIVLGTSSRERVDLLRRLGINVRVITPKGAKEVLRGNPRDVVLSNAESKLRSILSRGNIPKDALVIITADTLIVDEYGSTIGKARSVDEAKDILLRLKCKWHKVITGVCMYDLKRNKLVKFVVETKVKMRCYDDSEVDAYLSTNEWIGKAGAYAIQGLGSLLVEEIRGDFYNVVGLPIAKIHEELRKLGINMLSLRIRSYS